MKIGFIFGTETGNSEMLCEDIQADMGAGFDFTIENMGLVDVTALEADRFYFIVTSTYGNGDLPATAVPFTDKLEADKPDLSHVRFAIFGLGDMVFEATFAQGSETVMNLMLECGATMVGERSTHDASGADFPEDIAVPWAHDILAQLNAEAA